MTCPVLAPGLFFPSLWYDVDGDADVFAAEQFGVQVEIFDVYAHEASILGRDDAVEQ